MAEAIEISISIIEISIDIIGKRNYRFQSCLRKVYVSIGHD
jgi:hypothetical protein